MLRSRWYSIIRDVWSNKVRTLLVVMAIAVGVIAFGSVFIMRSILLSDMNTAYGQTNPATIVIKRGGGNASFVRAILRYPEVIDAEGVTRVGVRTEIDGQSIPIVLIARDDYDNIRINTFTPETGSFPPDRREIVFERSALVRFPNLQPGQTITVETPVGTERDLTIVGTVHDLNTVPYNFFPELNGFVSERTLRELGHSGSFTEVRVTVLPDLDTQQELEDTAFNLKVGLERAGYDGIETEIILPDRHWAADTSEAVITILSGVGIFALVLSGFLVVNTISAVLVQQKRQIGVMKSIGATNGATLRLYLTMVAIFGFLSLFIALPVGTFIGLFVVNILAFLLNLDVVRDAIFENIRGVLLMEVAVALFAPVIAGMVPIINGVRVTVREAIADYGIGGGEDGFIEDLLSRVRFLDPPVAISLRNTFREKMRLALTILMLTVAGSIFISIVNVRLSLINELNSLTELFTFDMQFVLNGPYRLSRLERVAQGVDGVELVEGWAFAQGTILREDGTESPNFLMYGTPPDSAFVSPTVLEGRWLTEDDTNAIVLGTEFMRNHPGLAVGDTMTITLYDQRTRWEIVGVINVVGQDSVYVNFNELSRRLGTPGQSYVMVVGVNNSSNAGALSIELEDALESQGIGVADTLTLSTILGAAIGQFNLIIALLLGMAVLLAGVGGLGLAGTMSLNVMERTREIGVMRSIGASNGAIRNIVFTEGILIGLLSCIISFLISLPLTFVLARVVGQALFDRNLAFAFTWLGLIAWLIVSIVVASAASLLPARRASRISIREALSY